MKKLFTLFIFFVLFAYKLNAQILLSSTTSGGTNVSITAELSASFNGQAMIGYYIIVDVPNSQAGITFGSFTQGPGLPAPDIQVSNIGTNGGRTYFALVSNVVSSGTALNNWLTGTTQTLLSFVVNNNTGSLILNMSNDAFSKNYITNNFGYTPPVSADININNSPTVTGYGTGSVILPINLKSFTAEKLNYNSSLLNWKSLSEENASHFDIEKSLDAENWVYVGTEKTRGSLNYGAEYSFVDENAVLLRNEENTVYYRLKMVDNDGSFQYSDVRLVTFERSLTDVEVYPNPSHEFFNWKMGVGDTQVHDAQLQLFDMTGKLVKKQTVSANGISKVDIAELETGLYNIVVKHEDQIYRKRIIKTN